MSDRESLIARIRHMRRSAEAGSQAEDRGPISEQDAIRALEARIVDLENMVQGLQDSVHREATRQGRRIADLEARIEPSELSRALSDDARQRGL